MVRERRWCGHLFCFCRKMLVFLVFLSNVVQGVGGRRFFIIRSNDVFHHGSQSCCCCSRWRRRRSRIRRLLLFLRFRFLLVFGCTPLLFSQSLDGLPDIVFFYQDLAATGTFRLARLFQPRQETIAMKSVLTNRGRPRMHRHILVSIVVTQTNGTYIFDVTGGGGRRRRRQFKTAGITITSHFFICFTLTTTAATTTGVGTGIQVLLLASITVFLFGNGNSIPTQQNVHGVSSFRLVHDSSFVISTFLFILVLHNESTKDPSHGYVTATAAKVIPSKGGIVHRNIGKPSLSTHA